MGLHWQGGGQQENSAAAICLPPIPVLQMKNPQAVLDFCVAPNLSCGAQEAGPFLLVTHANRWQQHCSVACSCMMETGWDVQGARRLWGGDVGQGGGGVSCAGIACALPAHPHVCWLRPCPCARRCLRATSRATTWRCWATSCSRSSRLAASSSSSAARRAARVGVCGGELRSELHDKSLRTSMHTSPNSASNS